MMNTPTLIPSRRVSQWELGIVRLVQIFVECKTLVIEPGSYLRFYKIKQLQSYMYLQSPQPPYSV